MAALASRHAVVCFLFLISYHSTCNPQPATPHPTPPQVQAYAPQRRVAFYLVFSLGLLGALHGACAVIVLGLSCLSYVLAQLLAGRQYG